MMNLSKTKKSNLLIVALLVILVIVFTLRSKNEFQKERPFQEKDISSYKNISCSYPQLLSTYYANKKILHMLPKPEKNPMIFTFSDFKNSEMASLSYIDSTQTITTVPIVKLVENEDKIIFLDGTGENYFSTHTIFKNTGVAVYTKSVDLFGTPSGTLSMGNCMGY